MTKKLQHGFTSREEWYDAFHRYYKHIREIDKRNYDLMIADKDCESWVRDFKVQSLSIRKAYLENDDFKQQHLYYFTKHPENWTAEIADSLTAYLFRYWHRGEDVETLYVSASSLLKYYEAQDNEIQIMKCQLVLVSVYHYLDDMHYTKRCFELCDSIINKLEDHYDELNEEDRSMAMSVYDLWNIMRYENVEIDENFQTLFDEELYPTLQRSIKMLERFWQSAHKDLEVNQAIPFILMNCKRMFASIALHIHKDTLRKDQLEIVQEVAQDILDYSEKSEYVTVQDEICGTMAFRFRDGESNNCLIQAFMRKLETLTFPFEESDTDKIDEVLTMLEYFASMLHTLNEEDMDCTHVSKEVLQRYVTYIQSLPFGKVMAHNVDQTVYNYLLPLLRYIEDENEIFMTLLNLTIFRQLQTAIHSCMVAKSATLILQHIIEKKPQLLVEQLGFATIEEVQIHESDLLSYIMRASLIHDVGKVLCSNVINMQYRNIIDVEFETIRFHPLSSSHILMDIPQLQVYNDIALGHHKSFDGKHGYPMEFDNVHSKQKILIDLIRICDSLDAATDTFGRLYATPKSFETVLKEFVQLKGTGYSDLLVEFIEADKQLQTELKALMEKGRESVYRKLYTFIQESVKRD